MDKEWSEKNKKMQALLAKEKTFAEGIKVLLELRNSLFEQITSIAKTFPPATYCQMPFGSGDGNHNATLAWSLWHLFRVEDIVAHTLILNDKQFLFKSSWLKKTKSPIVTTGNELDGEAMVEFSKKLSVKALYEYCKAVMDSTNELLKGLQFSDLKRKFSEEDKERLIAGKCVSADESASWLIDFWCNKNVKGLIQMPFSRHWIMHVEAMRKIKNKLCQQAKKIAESPRNPPPEKEFPEDSGSSWRENRRRPEDSGRKQVGKKMNEKLIEEAKLYIQEIFKDNSDGHDANHSLRVYKNALQIAKAYPECNMMVVALSSLLHDVDDHKLFDTKDNMNARQFLKNHGIGNDDIELICKIINGVSFSKNKRKQPETLEGKIVQDADRIDAIGAVGIARTFAYGGKAGRPLESSVQHFHDKLLLLKNKMNTQEAKKIAESRHLYMEGFLREFQKESKIFF